MPLYVLDTNILKCITKPTPPEKVMQWYNSIDETDLYISVISVMEQRKGIEKQRAKNPTLASQLERQFSLIITEFADRILPIDLDAAQEWGRMIASRDKDRIDLSMAATAKTKQFSMVTRNVPDFKGHGVRVVNPHKSPPEIIDP
jgi:toxin FitB